MASKVQKFNNYSDDLRNEVLNKYISGIPSSRLEQEYKIPQRTIRNWKRKYYSHPELFPGLGQKRRPIKESNLTKEDWKERYEIVKKISGILKGTTREKVTFIDLYRNKYKLSNICAVLDINKKCYGYRRITDELKNENEKYNIQAEYIRQARIKHKNKRIEDNVQPNLLNRNFNTDAPNKVSDTDVTYLIFKGVRAYLSAIIDLYNRHVVAYVISKRNDNKLVIETLNQALAK